MLKCLLSWDFFFSKCSFMVKREEYYKFSSYGRQKKAFITYKGEIQPFREFVENTHTHTHRCAKPLFSDSVWELFLPSSISPLFALLNFKVSFSLLLMVRRPRKGHYWCSPGSPAVGCGYSVIPEGGEEVSRGYYPGCTTGSSAGMLGGANWSNL